MPRERIPLIRSTGKKKDVTINISSIFRNEDVQNEIIKKFNKNDSRRV